MELGSPGTTPIALNTYIQCGPPEPIVMNGVTWGSPYKCPKISWVTGVATLMNGVMG